jgi:hypothetical protein
MAKTPRRLSKSITIESPVSGDNVGFFFTAKPITITSTLAVLTGSGTQSVVWSLISGTSRNTAAVTHISAESTSSITTGESEAIDVAAIPVSSHVWVLLGTIGATTTSFTLTVFYTE